MRTRTHLFWGTLTALGAALLLTIIAHGQVTYKSSGGVVFDGTVTAGAIDSLTITDLSDGVNDRLLTATFNDFLDNPHTNANLQAFMDLRLVGPVGRKVLVLTGTTPTLDWSVLEDIYHELTDDTTYYETNAPTDTNWVGRLSVTLTNSTSGNIQITTPDSWSWQRAPEQIAAYSWMQITVEWKYGSAIADWSGSPTASTVQDGGTGRSTHPENYLLVGGGALPTGAAEIGSGLSRTGTGQAMALSVRNSVATPAVLEITTVTAGANVWTNTAGTLSTNTSTFLSADVLFSGDTNTVAISGVKSSVRFGPELTTSINQTVSGNADGLWARWTTNASYLPVLMLGGIDGEPGLLQLENVQQWSMALTATLAPAVDPWLGHIFTESFEGTGYENTPDILSSGWNADYTTQKLHGDQSVYISNPAASRTIGWYLAEGYDRLSGRVSFYVSAHPGVNGTSLVSFRDSNTASGNLITAVQLRTDGTIRVANNGGQSGVSVASVPTESWVTVYWEWVKGGGANETLKAGWSTDGNKTSTANNIAEYTNGDRTAQVKQVQIVQPASAGNAIAVDAIVIHPTLTWANLPNGLPDDM